jgi:DNA-binding MarR family transcriptional regulator
MVDSSSRGGRPRRAAGDQAAREVGGGEADVGGEAEADVGGEAEVDVGGEAVKGATAGGTDPGPADLPVSVVGLLFRLAPRLVELQDLGAREYGLGFARGRVLWALSESGPVVMRALAEALGISPRTVTGLVDALENDGWVTRGPHPADRRATIISLTPAAHTALAKLRATYEGLAHDLLGDLAPDDLTRARAVITTLEQRLDGAVSDRTSAFGPAPGPRLHRDYRP